MWEHYSYALIATLFMLEGFSRTGQPAQFPAQRRNSFKIKIKFKDSSDYLGPCPVKF